MKENVDFLIKINKLKETPRTGWVLMKVKNPETIAEHIFRVCFNSWFLGRIKKLNEEKLIKTALSHDLCEVYAGDKTPFFYWEKLDRNKKEEEKILLKGIRLSKEEKEKRSKAKFENEKKSLLKLLRPLKKDLKEEIFTLWMDYEKRVSPVGKFVKQIDRVETLLQSIEYFSKEEGGTSWWELTEEIVDDPLILEFLEVIQKKFYKKRIKKTKNTRKLERILDFLLEIGKIKRLPRLYWRLRETKNPETVAGHIFTLTIMAWIFGREKKNLNIEKLLKMALCHELSAVYTGDTTQYDRILPQDKEERKKILQKMLRLSKKEKKWIFAADYKEEEKAFKKLTKKLNSDLKEEILQLWKDYRKRNSLEARFLSQLNTLSVLFQGLFYEKEDKNFTAQPLWEWAFETCEDELCVRLLEEMKNKFYGD
jgi:putative hydrolase of HD superfamily